MVKKKKNTSKSAAKRKSSYRPALKTINDIDSALTVAERLAHKDKHDEVLATLEKFKGKYPFDSAEQAARFDYRLAFAQTELRNFTEAESFADRGLKSGQHGLDFLYLLTYLKLVMREPSEAIKYGDQFLKALEDESVTVAKKENTLLSQFYNNYATALRQLGSIETALEYFAKGIEADSGNQLPYLNLAETARQAGDKEKASETVSAGLRKCRQVQELRMLAEMLKTKGTISACLMVKNEEEMLPACLESIRCWVDEIIVLDTGSTDRTVEIAKSYGAKVFFQEWENDFSKHRNYSMEQATSDWIFIIDADERFVLEDLSSVRDAINEDKYSIISFNVLNLYGKNKDKVTFLNSVRLFKKELNLTYKGIVHNILQFPPGSEVLRTRARIKHLGYDLSEEKMQAKFKRTGTLLEQQLKADPDNVFSLYNYAQLLLGEGIGQYENYAPKIIEVATKLVSLTNPETPGLRPYYLMGLNQLAYGFFYLNEYEKAIESAQKALAAREDYLDPIMLLGHAYNRLGRADLSDRFYKRYLTTQQRFDGVSDEDSLMLFHPASNCDSYYGMANNAYLLDDEERACELFEKIFKIKPGYQDVASQLGRIEMSRGNLEKARYYFNTQLEKGEFDILAALGLAHEALQREDFDQFEKYLSSALEGEIVASRIPLLTKFAESFVSLKQPLAAIKLYERSRLINDGVELIRPLADLYFSQGQYTEAIELYNNLTEIDSENADILNNLGNSYFKSKNYSEAACCYQKALEKEEVPSQVYRNLGLSQAQLGQTKEAISSLNRYLRLNPAHNEVLPILGDLYVLSTEYEEAVASYERYLGQFPQNAMVIFALSECYLAMGHRDSARLGYQRVLELIPGFQPAENRLQETGSKELPV